MSDTRIVVVGAGVSGLTSALLLSRNPKYKITVIAKHMPGDYDIEYASPWAGANYMPVSAPNTAAAQHDRDTWPELERLARERSDAGVHFQEARNFRRATDSGPVADWQSEPVKADAWFKDVVPNFRPLEPSELRGHDSGTTYTSVCINTAIYLPWLVSQCLLTGVTFHRAILLHINEAAALFRSSPLSASAASHAQNNPNGHQNGLSEPQRADVVINCTGLGSKRLGGVEDAKMYPARGQIVLVRNETPFMGGTTSVVDGEDEACYIMGRAVGGGTILGGCYQPHNYECAPDPNLAIRIMKRCVELVPELVQGKHPAEAQPPPNSIERTGTQVSGADIAKLSVIRHGVGLRPCREGGVRLAKEKLEADGGKSEKKHGKGDVWVVHDYGHAGYGYQSSYGCSMEVVRLVGECVDEMKGAARTA